jgi:glycopeptide antibiotics resistance protein
MARRRWLGWLAVIALVDGPWWGYVGHPHWTRIQWIPYVSPPVRILDSLVNVALFVPFGYLACRGFEKLAAQSLRVRLAAVALGVFAVAAACEVSQTWAHGRFSSATDVANNVIGGMLGVWLEGRGSQPSPSVKGASGEPNDDER